MSAILLEPINFEVVAETVTLPAGTTVRNADLVRQLEERGVSLVRFDENGVSA